MAIIKDDRTDEEVRNTIGFVVATDSFMSGWGDAPGKSIVAVPVINDKDREWVEVVMSHRSEMKRLRFAYGSNYKPRLGKDDHLHIYNTNTSFRRCPTCSGGVTQDDVEIDRKICKILGTPLADKCREFATAYEEKKGEWETHESR